MSTPLPPKWCPECRDEFIHAMERCPVCDVALVAELDSTTGDAPASKWVHEWAEGLDQKAAEEQRQRQAWSEAEVCPACETPVDLSASECAECGLAFVEQPGEG